MRAISHTVLALLTAGAFALSQWSVWLHRSGIPYRDSATQLPTSSRVVDATGTSVPIQRYRRIASCSAIADAVLPDLVSMDRVISVTSWFAGHSPLAFRNRGKTLLLGVSDLEPLILLQPDLIIVSDFNHDMGPLARLRERGLLVFDLGHRLGQASLEQSMRQLGLLLDEKRRGEELAQAFHRRMRQVSAHIPLEQRRRGLYLNVSDTQLLGGTRGSSYHDVLTAAGLVDVAEDFAEKRVESNASRRAWPIFRAEDLLRIDPDVIVTPSGKVDSLRAMQGLSRLRALGLPNGVVELDRELLEDAGPGMLRAAEILNDLLYPTVGEHQTGSNP